MPQEKEHSSVGGNIAGSLAPSLAMAGLFCAYSLLLFVFRGNAPFRKIGMSLPTVLVFYVAGAVVVGVLAGLMLPLARTVVGAALVGLVTALPVFLMVRIALQGFGAWSSADAEMIIALSALYGPAVALFFRHQARKLK